MSLSDTDVVIIGAGLSGIGAACHLQRLSPGERFVILEGRTQLGGTWDLFRYPGVRSDSDMFTLGYGFRPWRQAKAIADGPSILRYLQDTAREHGLLPHMRFGHRLTRADWDSTAARWTLQIEQRQSDGSVCQQTMRCRFLFMCSGYYRYEAGHQPQWPGMADYGGRLVHPQHWPDDLEHEGRRVLVIGSGATAVTLVPAMAERAAGVTLLQRSPTWMASRPSRDAVADLLRRTLPAQLAHALARWKQVLLGLYFYSVCKRHPRRAGRWLHQQLRAAMGDSEYARWQAHLSPRYAPWDQRLCLVPDADLFRALRENRACIVTGEIERFTAGGVLLADGRTLEADIVVSATGLHLQQFGGARLFVDGEPVQPAQRLNYKGAMLSGVPNFAATFGYTNASWTLKSDLVAAYVCRVLNRLRKSDQGLGTAWCMPPHDPAQPSMPLIDFSSGYIQRALADLPRQGTVPPWRLHQNYPRDILLLRWSRIDDGVLQFHQAPT